MRRVPFLSVSARVYSQRRWIEPLFKQPPDVPDEGLRHCTFSMVNVLLILLCVVLIITPCLATICQGTGLRRALWRAGYYKWVVCCDRLFGSDAHEQLERGYGQQQPVSICFGRLPSTRAQQTSSQGLQLAAWREDLRRHQSIGIPLATQLEEIQMKNEYIQRDEPIEIVTIATCTESPQPHPLGLGTTQADTQRSDQEPPADTALDVDTTTTISRSNESHSQALTRQTTT